MADDAPFFSIGAAWSRSRPLRLILTGQSPPQIPPNARFRQPLVCGLPRRGPQPRTKGTCNRNRMAQHQQWSDEGITVHERRWPGAGARADRCSAAHHTAAVGGRDSVVAKAGSAEALRQRNLAAV